MSSPRRFPTFAMGVLLTFAWACGSEEGDPALVRASTSFGPGVAEGSRAAVEATPPSARLLGGSLSGVGSADQAQTETKAETETEVRCGESFETPCAVFSTPNPPAQTRSETAHEDAGSAPPVQTAGRDAGAPPDASQPPNPPQPPKPPTQPSPPSDPYADCVGWHPVPNRWGRTIADLCGACEVGLGRRCSSAGGQEIYLRCLYPNAVTVPPQGYYDNYRVENCSSTPNRSAVIWSAIQCVRPTGATRTACVY